MHYNNCGVAVETEQQQHYNIIDDGKSSLEDFMGTINVAVSNMQEEERRIKDICSCNLTCANDYLSVLYLRVPESFRIILRGQAVKLHNMADNLKDIEYIVYRPKSGGLAEALVVTTIGFLKEAPALGIHDFNIYHKNHLILLRYSEYSMYFEIRSLTADTAEHKSLYLHLIFEEDGNLQGDEEVNLQGAGEGSLQGLGSASFQGVIQVCQQQARRRRSNCWWISGVFGYRRWALLPWKMDIHGNITFWFETSML
ncbi:hypothetical protein RYX36_004761 [Vicia faba]